MSRRASNRASGGPILGGIPELPERQYDHKTHVPVLDLKGVYSVPFNSEEEGVKSFSVLIFPRDHVTHVENSPGKYVSDGPWSQERCLSIVYFIEGTRRTPELLLGFIDHGIAQRDSVGFSVESLPLPLLKGGSKFECNSNLRSPTSIIHTRHFFSGCVPTTTSFPGPPFIRSFEPLNRKRKRNR